MFTLAHLSDPHVPSPLALSLGVLASKRIFGYWSWHRRRVFIHSAVVLDALAEDLAENAPDHVAVTGDLVNISLPNEFPAAAHWLETLGPAETVSVVPGNHDAYVAVPWAESCGLWSAYMTGERSGGRIGPPAGPDDFPYVRRHGDVAIVGLSTSTPTPPGWASGRLGDDQLARLEDLLARLGEEGRFRIVLLHHPPIEGDNPVRKRLMDAAALQEVVARHGAELLLHGHDHRCSIRMMGGPAGGVPAVGVPSASAVVEKHRPVGQYHLFEIARTPRGWRIDLRQRRYSAANGRFEAAGEERLEIRSTRAPAVAVPLAAGA
ncbi:MAG TPA: metallophosphoesterase [Rhodospirillales bacterium]|jgi:3',5'-cyclic AMP phosphodiesterase CpdA|nr:metallophosphoesterase [Rhodospirillales bacterium]